MYDYVNAKLYVQYGRHILIFTHVNFDLYSDQNPYE